RAGSRAVAPGQPAVRQRQCHRARRGSDADRRSRHPRFAGVRRWNRFELTAGPMTMHFGRTTLSKFLIQQLHDRPDAGKLAGLLVDVAAAIKALAALAARGALVGSTEIKTVLNASGEDQKPLDLIANDAVIRCCEWGGQLAAMASEELEEPYLVPETYER